MGMSRQNYAAFMNSMGLLADTAQNLQAQRYQAELLKRKDAELEQQQTLKQVQSAVEVWKNAKNPDTKAAIASNILVPSMRKLYPDMPQDQFDLVSKAFANPDNKSVAKYMDYVKTGLEDMNKGLIKPEELWSNVGLRHAELAETEMSPEQWKVVNDNRDEVKRQVGLSLLKPQADGTVNRESQASGYSLLGQNDEVSKLYQPKTPSLKQYDMGNKTVYMTEEEALANRGRLGGPRYKPDAPKGSSSTRTTSRTTEPSDKSEETSIAFNRLYKMMDDYKKKPNANKLEIIKKTASKLGYDFKEFKGKTAVYGIPGTDKLNWGGKETSEYRLVPKGTTNNSSSTKRTTAITELKKNGYPVTESNISALLKQMGN